MNSEWSIAANLALAYLVCAVPVGFILGRLRGIDLREIGSGNIGATNAVRAMGRRWGVLVFCLDVLKGYGTVFLARLWLAEIAASPLGADRWAAIAAAAAVVGHVFPVYLGFRGGKGVATALGAYAVFDPIAGVTAVAIYLQTLWLTRISAIGSLTGVTAMTLMIVGRPEIAWPIKLSMGASALLIFWRHRANLSELRARA